MPDSDELQESTEAPMASSAVAAPARFRRMVRLAGLLLLLAWLSQVFWNSAKPLPAGMHGVSQTSRLPEADAEFLFEHSGQPQTAAPALGPDLSAIDHAEQLIVLDRSPVGADAARHLLVRQHARPNLKIVVVTDPGSEILGGTPPLTLASLEQAGVIVARVRLDRLRDSNPLYTGAWRIGVGWWSDPFDDAPGQIGPAAWLRSMNCKADQRQLLVADDGAGGWISVVAAADARATLVLRGALARAMVSSELQVAAWSTDDDRLPSAPALGSRGVGSIDARFLTEGGLQTALLDALSAAGAGDRISLAVDTVSHRPFIHAALLAAARGARIQVLLARNRIPNQAVAGELRREGGGHIQIRWDTPEPGRAQPSLLMVQHGSDLWLNLSSANFTRRNLDDLNLEAGVDLRMPARTAPARAATEYFAQIWAAASDESDPAEESMVGYWRYRIEEWTGLSSF